MEVKIRIIYPSDTVRYDGMGSELGEPSLFKMYLHSSFIRMCEGQNIQDLPSDLFIWKYD